ncbi:MAG TPA: hypothetical protein VFS02_19600 [Telluria sp.]|nr:hypothetical protein [Telluria sp.]
MEILIRQASEDGALVGGRLISRGARRRAGSCIWVLGMPHPFAVRLFFNKQKK